MMWFHGIIVLCGRAAHVQMLLWHICGAVTTIVAGVETLVLF